MCKALEDFAEKKKREGKIELIPDLLKAGMAVEVIAEILKMTVDEVSYFAKTAENTI